MLELSSRVNVEPAGVSQFIAEPQVGSIDQSRHDMYSIYSGYTRSKEYILSDNDGSHHSWKPCQHYTCQQVSGSGVNGVDVPVDRATGGKPHVGLSVSPFALYRDDQYGNAGEPNYGLPSFYQPEIDGSFVPPPADLDIMLQRGFATMMPRIKAELSLVNSLIELKDFLTLRSTIESVLQTFSTLHKERWSKAALRTLFRTKADVYLQYKFNISPLLSDISGIYRSVARTERRINDFISRSGRVRVSHFEKTLTESTDPSPSDSSRTSFTAKDFPSGGTYPILATNHVDRIVETEPTSFHVEVEYNYNYTQYQIEHARILALLDAFGVNLDPSIIWNAIPWSFVVDWVLGVGRYLDSFKVSNMDPKINILRCLWSVKRKRRILLEGRVVSPVGAGLPDFLPLASLALPTVVETAYRRSPFMPGSSLIESSGLSSTEFSLGAALVISQRRRQPKTRR